MLTENEVEAIKPVRYARKIWDGRGLFLLVTPKGGRCWRYAYRFAKKYRGPGEAQNPSSTDSLGFLALNVWYREQHPAAKSRISCH